MDDPYPFPTCDSCGARIPPRRMNSVTERHLLKVGLWRFEWERQCPSCGAPFDPTATGRCRFCKKWVRPGVATCRYCGREDPTGDIAVRKSQWERHEREEKIKHQRWIIARNVLIVLGIALAIWLLS